MALSSSQLGSKTTTLCVFFLVFLSHVSPSLLRIVVADKVMYPNGVDLLYNDSQGLFFAFFLHFFYLLWYQMLNFV